VLCKIVLENSFFLTKIWAHRIFKNNTIFRLKDVKELTYAAFGKITKDVWTKAEEHVVKIKKVFVCFDFHEYKARFVFGFRLDYKLSLFIFF
jgi:hypothetical protein